jgi:hypothetical protein
MAGSNVPDRALHIYVRGSTDLPFPGPPDRADPPRDAAGHAIGYLMILGHGHGVVDVFVRGGLKPAAAAAALRKVADRVERNGAILDVPVGTAGEFDLGGRAVQYSFRVVPIDA